MILHFKDGSGRLSMIDATVDMSRLTSKDWDLYTNSLIGIGDEESKAFSMRLFPRKQLRKKKVRLFSKCNKYRTIHSKG